MKSELTPQNISKILDRWKQYDPMMYASLTGPVPDKDFQKARTKVLDSIRPQIAREGVDSDRVIREVIALAKGRPVLSIQNGSFRPVFDQAEDKLWEERLSNEEVKTILASRIPAVGRIELRNHRKTWVGTGWLIADDIVVTNRHVAREFAGRQGDGFAVFIGRDNRNPVIAEIDFIEEFDSPRELAFQIEKVLWIEPNENPDIALLQVKVPTADLPPGSGLKMPRPIPLDRDIPSLGQFVAAIGYPAKDSRAPDQELVLKIFGDVYDKKRLSPGMISDLTSSDLLHDCSTLGGNSGSALISLKTGAAVGLHYGGIYGEDNYAVPAEIIADRVDKVTRGGRPKKVSQPPSNSPPSPQPRVAVRDKPVELVPKVEGATVRIHIPLEITVRVGASTISTSDEPSAVPSTLEQAVTQVKDLIGNIEGVMAVRRSYLFRNGWITDEKVVEVAVHRSPDNRTALESALAGLPAQIGKWAIQVCEATPIEVLRNVDPAIAVQLESVEPGDYQPPKDLALERVHERMQLRVHTSPDSGFPELKAFFRRVEDRLTATMYEFEARYIYDELYDAVKNSPRTFNFVVQNFAPPRDPDHQPQTNEIQVRDAVRLLKNRLRDRMDYSWASVTGPDKLFPKSYHIKVAVRDGEEFWLSSGNWKDSGQPKLDYIDIDETSPSYLHRYNREWHVVLKNRNLAQQFENFILWDLSEAKRVRESSPEELPVLYYPEAIRERRSERRTSEARYFKPLLLDREVDVQPLLTPDNYYPHVLELIESAQDRLYFQNQSLNPLQENNPEFQALLDALIAKQKAGLDVRIIVRDSSEFPGGMPNLRQQLRILRDNDFDMRQVRVQLTCHNKGIIVDGERSLLGSHNWTNTGALYNRDASLIFFDQEIAAYLEEIFLFDWENLTSQELQEESVPFTFSNKDIRGRRTKSMPLMEGIHY